MRQLTECLHGRVERWFVCEGGVTGAASAVSLPRVTVVWRTDRCTAGLAGTVSEVHSTAAENSTRLRDIVTSDHQTRSSSSACADPISRPASQW